MKTLSELRPGDESETFEVTGHPIRQPDGEVRVPVMLFAEPWRPSFVNGDADEEVVVIHQAAA